MTTIHEALNEAPLVESVRAWRVRLGLSQNALARRAGVDPSILSRVLAGKAVAGPSVRKLERWFARQAKRWAPPAR